MILKSKATFNRMAFWRSTLKHKAQIESLGFKVSKAVQKGNCKDIFDMAVSSIDLDLMHVSELLPMYPKAIMEMDESDTSDLIRVGIICDQRPKQVLELLKARTKKASNIIKAGRPAAFTALEKDEIPNGFMGWRKFIK